MYAFIGSKYYIIIEPQLVINNKIDTYQIVVNKTNMNTFD